MAEPAPPLRNNAIMAEPMDSLLVPMPTNELTPITNTCKLWAINTTCDIVCRSTSFMEPEKEGHEKLNLPTYAFYIHNTRLDRRVLFDNGSRRDWWNVPPAVLNGIQNKSVSGFAVQRDVHEILTAGGVDPKAIEAVVWSHFHWDHIGNMSLFPKSTSLVVGPGFSTLLPGYPQRRDAPFYQDDLEDRETREINFDNDAQQIGPFKAYDYFGDGSFYLLDTPGHTMGHISGLVRTTPTTFVFLGGDIAHFPGMYRPTPYVPLPDIVPTETVLDSRFPSPCSHALFTACHHESDPAASRTTPFYQVSAHSDSWYDYPELAQKSVDGLKELDADENVFVAISHDPALREVANFPTATLNDWRAQGWGRKLRWNFLNELPIKGQAGRAPLVHGLLRGGKPYV